MKYSSGFTPASLQFSTRVKIFIFLSPASGCPINVQFFAPIFNGLIVPSAKLLSILKDFEFTDLDNGMKKVYERMGSVPV